MIKNLVYTHQLNGPTHSATASLFSSLGITDTLLVASSKSQPISSKKTDQPTDLTHFVIVEHSLTKHVMKVSSTLEP